MTDHPATPNATDHVLSAQQEDALWDALAIPGPRTPTFTEQHVRVCRAVAAILAEQPLVVYLAADGTTPVEALLSSPLSALLNKHLLQGQQAEEALARVRAIPRLPHSSQQTGLEGRAYTRGWQSVIDMLDYALAQCCVCGRTPVIYRNYQEQPFCSWCGNCPCDQDPCVRTGLHTRRPDSPPGHPDTPPADAPVQPL